MYANKKPLGSIKDVGEFKIDSQVLKKIKKSSGVISGSSKHENRIDTIKKVYNINQLVVDPHTADGIFVANKNYDDSCPMVCLETALPTKFEETVMRHSGLFQIGTSLCKISRKDSESL